MVEVEGNRMMVGCKLQYPIWQVIAEIRELGVRDNGGDGRFLPYSIRVLTPS
jgi:hypothetical protein